jgi:hypothetical protein
MEITTHELAEWMASGLIEDARKYPWYDWYVSLVRHAYQQGAELWTLGDPWEATGTIPMVGKRVDGECAPCFCGKGLKGNQWDASLMIQLRRGRWGHSPDCARQLAGHLVTDRIERANYCLITACIDPPVMCKWSLEFIQQALSLESIYTGKPASIWLPLHQFAALALMFFNLPSQTTRGAK